MRVVAGLLAVALTGCGAPTVVRVIDGHPVEGRFISTAAYALYARGAEAEAAGDLPGAARAFTAAAEEDPASPEIWTHLAALRCRMTPRDTAAGDVEALFARAEAANARYAPLSRERAACALHRGQPAAALAAAERAAALDPGDEEAVLVRAEALAQLGRTDEAMRALRSVTAKRPHAVEAWQAMASLAARTGDATAAKEAADHLRAPAPLAAVDAAILAGDLAAAQQAAHRARIAWAELALRAAALGRAAPAREQAALVLAANPGDISAQIAEAAGADLAGDKAAVEAALRALPARPAAPSSLGRLVFAELLARRAGADAARGYLGPEGAADPPDPLGAAVAARLRARLASPR